MHCIQISARAKAVRLALAGDDRNTALSYRRNYLTPASSKYRRLGSVLLIVASLAWNTSLFAQSPYWIWPQEQRSPNTVATWQKKVRSPTGVQQAQLSGVADFCRISVRLNGEEVATAESFNEPFFVDVTRWMRDQDNLIEVRAVSEPGPAAIALRLEITPVQGKKQVVVTDKSWSSTLASGARAPASENREESAELGEVREFELDPQRQFGITALDDYEQWKQALQTDQSTDPSSFLVAPGFQIELIRSAQKDEGSWVSMAFDPRGRIVIGREDRGLVRMTLAADGRSITKVETVNDTLLECRGLLFAHDSLYANANNSKGLYRLRDSDGDDQFDEVKLLRQFEGGVGHGRNDLTLGPDGMIYLIHGDSVDLPTDSQAVDWTSPFREHRRGQKSHEGHLLRTDRDGREWHLLTAGLRNPYGIAFNAEGEAFTYDADAEFDMGSPWYRPTQVKHLVAGADFGWRGVTGRWPPYYPDHPDNALPTAHIGKGSPTSVKFGPGMGSRFPPPYRDAFFILDWAYGRIIAVHLTPRGASYTGRPEHFLKGRPLNVTDLDFGPDGAMYFVTGGRKTQAGLYRVRYVGPEMPPTTTTTQQRARQQYSATARSLRHELEALLISKDKTKIVIDTAWPHLDSSDPWIRYAARMVVEHQPIATWRDRAFGEEQTTARLAALLVMENPSRAQTQRSVS
jgi:glucose/arabinose dehydrogenase